MSTPRSLHGWRLLRSALGLLAVALLLVAVWNQRAQIGDAIDRLEPVRIAVSVLPLLGALVASMLAWRTLVDSTGPGLLSLPSAARLYFVTQIGKYLPGAIWPVAGQMSIGREAGIPVSRSALAAAASLCVMLGTGIVVGLAAVVAASGSPGHLWWLTLLLPVVVLLLRPSLLARAVEGVLRRSGRSLAGFQLGGRALLVCAAWSVLAWLLLGTHLGVLVAGLTAEDDAWLTSIGAYALAWVAGFVVVFAPAGGGVREFTLVLLLEPVLDRPEALAVAVLARVLAMGADLVMAGAAMAAARLGWRRTTSNAGG